MHSIPFTPVQEASTLHQYSIYWTRLIILLIRLQAEPIRQQLDDTYTQLDEHVQVTLQDLIFAASEYAASNESYDTEESPDESESGRRTASLIRTLSHQITRFSYQTTIFRSPVIRFLAFLCLSESGSWQRATYLQKPITALMHCMQLWLADYCISQQTSTVVELESLFKAECKLFLVNNSRSPLGELSFWRLLTRTASKDITTHPVTVVDDQLTTVTHHKISLNLDAWRAMLQDMLQSAGNIFQDKLVFGLHAVPLLSPTRLYDSTGDHHALRSFIDDARNTDMRLLDRWLVQKVYGREELRQQYVLDDGSYCTGKMTEYIHWNDRFLELLALLIYMTSGLPPRRDELLSSTWRNWETPRNIYISNGLVVIITSYHKAQWRVGSRPVARFLPPKVGFLLVQYLILVFPFLRFLYSCMQKPPHQAFLFSNGGETPWNAQHFTIVLKRQVKLRLGFTISPREWRHIAIALDRRALQGVGCQVYNVSDGYGLHAVSREDDEEGADEDSEYENSGPSRRARELDADNPGSVVAHMQASHTVGIGRDLYGNADTIRFGLTDALLASFREVSMRWHTFCRLDGAIPESSIQTGSISTVCCSTATTTLVTTPATSRQQQQGKKRPSSQQLHAEFEIRQQQQPGPKISRQAGSSLLIRRDYWTWQVIVTKLQQLFGPHATVKSLAQQDALRLVTSCYPECFIILPTGGGKTILYVLPTLLPHAETTVVIVPLVALRHDLTRRCDAWGIQYGTFTSEMSYSADRLHAVPPLLLVDIDNAFSANFRALLVELSSQGRLDRIVLDEAHILLTASHYRYSLKDIAGLRSFECPFVCLTGTLPPTAEFDLKHMLHATTPRIIRASGNRPNLQYLVEESHWDRSVHATRDDALIARAVEVGQRLIRTLESMQAGGTRKDDTRKDNTRKDDTRKDDTRKDNTSGRGILYVRTKDIGQRISQQLNCYLYHATLHERGAQLAAWVRGDRSRLIVATSALSAGIDQQSVRVVIHVDAPAGLLDYAQETGRAGRDGERACCITLLTERWKVSWNKGHLSDFLDEDCKQMTSFLQMKGCLRQRLTRYLDGGSGVVCSMEHADKFVRCSWCASRGRSDQPQNISSSRDLVDFRTSTASSPIPATSGRVRGVGDTREDRAGQSRQQSRLLLREGLSSQGTTLTKDDEDFEEEYSSKDKKKEKGKEGRIDKDKETTSGEEEATSEEEETTSEEEETTSEEEETTSKEEEEEEEDKKSNSQQKILIQARRLATMQAVDTARAITLYQDRVASWSYCCIPCSFTQKQQLYLPHARCTQSDSSVAQFRRGIKFDPYIGCYECGQPLFICERVKNRRCTQSLLVFWVCMTAWDRDRASTAEILGLLQANQRLHVDNRASFQQWMGRKVRFFEGDVSNAARFTYYWLDRLHAVCR